MLEENGSTMREYVNYALPMIQLVLYNILIEFGIPMKIVRLIKIYIIIIEPPTQQIRNK
jgi:hypothetical protein